MAAIRITLTTASTVAINKFAIVATSLSLAQSAPVS